MRSNEVAFVRKDSILHDTLVPDITNKAICVFLLLKFGA
jgi:hypothetical protein